MILKNTYSFIAILCIFLFACEERYAPKPTAYFRIDLPEKEYKLIDDIPFPFSFELPQYGTVNLERTAEDSSFLNLDFDRFQARIHMSYLPIEGNFRELLEDSRTLVYKHVAKAQDIEENLILDPKSKVYGSYFSIEGNAASSAQFYLTDSGTHFLRGALYFNVEPNADSIQPVQTFLKEDISHFMQSFSWK